MRRKREELTDEERHDKVMKLISTRSYSIADAANLIGCSVRKIYMMMDDNRLKYEPPTLKHPHRRIKGIFIREAYLNY